MNTNYTNYTNDTNGFGLFVSFVALVRIRILAFRLTFLLFLWSYSFSCFSQEVAFTPSDSSHTYHIITLKDGTVLKGKIIRQEKKSVLFQDEMIGSVTFRTKDVSSMEKVEPQDYYLITMMNGTTLQGKIINKKENEISVETANIGVVTVDVSKIKTIKEINPGNMKDGKYWFKTHIDAHYFVTPSAIPLSPGEAYFQNTMGLYNSFNVGITNHFSCMGGVVLPLAAFISPNVSFRITKGIYAGGGVIAADINNTPYAYAGYGQVTFGDRNAHLSIGGGYGVLQGIKKYYYINKITKIEVGLISVSAMKRFSPKYAIVTENWFTPTEGITLFTGGLRLMGEKSSWDFGVARASLSRHIAGNNFKLGPISFLSYMRNL
jgi:hypothetical protein